MPDLPERDGEDVGLMWTLCTACELGLHRHCIKRTIKVGKKVDCDCSILGHILDEFDEAPVRYEEE